PPLLAFDDEEALALDDEEALLLGLAVVERHRLAGLEHVDAGADLGAVRNEHRAGAELLVHPPLGVGDVLHEPVSHGGSSSRRARSAGRARRTPRSRRPPATRTPRRTRGSGGAAHRRTAGTCRASPPRSPRTTGAQRRNRDRMRPSPRGPSDAPPAASPPLSPCADLSRGRPGDRGLWRRSAVPLDAARSARPFHACQAPDAPRPARDPRRAAATRQ